MSHPLWALVPRQMCDLIWSTGEAALDVSTTGIVREPRGRGSVQGRLLAKPRHQLSHPQQHLVAVTVSELPGEILLWKETKWLVSGISVRCPCVIFMISKQLLPSLVNLGHAFPGRRLGVNCLDLTCLKETDFKKDRTAVDLQCCVSFRRAAPWRRTGKHGLLRWPSGTGSACNAGDVGDTGSIPGSGRSPGGKLGNPLQYSCLENSMDRGVWRATVHRVTKSWTQLKWLSKHTHTHPYIFFSDSFPL